LIMIFYLIMIFFIINSEISLLEVLVYRYQGVLISLSHELKIIIKNTLGVHHQISLSRKKKHYQVK
jgi:hypothetical protein